MAGPVRDPGKIPGPVYIPNVAAIRLIWTLPNGKTASNILHASFPAGTTFAQATADSLWTAISGAFTSSGLKPFMHENTKLNAVGVRDLTQIAGSSFGHGEWISSGTPVPGTDTVGEALPANVAACVTLRTGQSRQANRGRVYLGGFSVAANDADGHIDAGAGGGSEAFINAIKAALNSATPVMVMCIAHPARQGYTGRTGVVYPARNAGSVPVQAVKMRDLVWDTQRLRTHL